MARNSTLHMRIDDDLKQQADQLFQSLGLDTPTAIRMFLAQSVRQRGLPFEVSLQNPETRQALEDARTGQNLHGPFDTAGDLMASLQEGDGDDV